MLSLSQALLSISTARAGYALIDLAAEKKLSIASSGRVCMHYVLEGAVVIEFDAQARTLAAGDFACLFRGGAHRLSTSNASDDHHSRIMAALKPGDDVRRVRIGAKSEPPGARVLSGSFELSETDGLPPELPMPDFIITPVGEAGLSSMPPPDLVIDACAGSGAHAFAAGLMRMQFVQALRREVVQGRAGDFLAVLGAGANDVGRGQTLIERRFREHWTVGKLAQTVGMSRSTFAEHFAASTGEGPIARLTAVRLEEARRLLHGPGGITEIAHTIGYSSIAAFSRAFRKHHGETPTAYRRRCKAKPAPDS